MAESVTMASEVIEKAFADSSAVAGKAEVKKARTWSLAAWVTLATGSSAGDGRGAGMHRGWKMFEM